MPTLPIPTLLAAGRVPGPSKTPWHPVRVPLRRLLAPGRGCKPFQHPQLPQAAAPVAPGPAAVVPGISRGLAPAAVALHPHAHPRPSRDTRSLAGAPHVSADAAGTGWG